MIGGKVLNSSATLNSFQVIQSIDFSPGEQIKLVIQLYQRQREDQLRYVVADLTATLTVDIPARDGTETTFSLTPMDDDRSIWSVVLTSEDTAELAGGNMILTLNEDGVMSIGVIQNALQLVVSGGAC